MDFTPPAVDTRYKITGLLGQGGFAAVYQAWDTHLNRPCAIKENRIATPAAQRQFEREAKLLAQLRHPNLPRVIDHFIIPEQGQYLVMDYVEGEDLLHLLNRRGQPLDENEALSFILPVCDALTYLHRQDPPIIHRDVKPQNIILTPQGQPYLVDFGIAKTFSPQMSTTIGARAVSPGYSPPEQYGQSATDERSDQYALGATLYTLLTNYTPPDSVDVMTGALPPAPPIQALNSRVSPHIAAAVERAMQLSRQQRYDNMAAFRQALTQRPGQGPATRPMPAEVFPAAPAGRAASGALVAEAPVQRVLPAPSSRPRSRPVTGALSWGMPVVAGIGLLGLVGIAVVIWLIMQPRSRSAGLVNTPENAARPTTAIPTLVASEPAATAPVVVPPAASDTPQPSETPTETPTPTATLFRTHVDDVTMISVPAGQFRMGINNREAQWHVQLCNLYSTCNAVDYEDAMPAHDVSLRAFRMDAHEVTNRQYAACVAANVCPAVDPTVLAEFLPASYPSALEYAEYPAVGMTWDSANLYCQWVGKRLPSEAQWERAASGDGSMLFPWGDPDPNDPLNVALLFGGRGPLLNYCDAQCQFNWHDIENDDGWAGPAPVMSYPPNFMGFFDLVGNVQEWVLDFYDSSYYGVSPDQDPLDLVPSACPGRSELTCHIARGGGWNNGIYHSTARFRYFADASQTKAYRGFRCVSP